MNKTCVGRMEYEKRCLYFQLTIKDFKYFFHGFIFVPSDPERFLNGILNESMDQHSVWKGMINDGLIVEKPSSFDLYPCRWKGLPRLKLLCHMSIYNNREKLSSYIKLLPYSLMNIEKFNRIRETREKVKQIEQQHSKTGINRKLNYY